MTSLSSFVLDYFAFILFSTYVFSDGKISLASAFNIESGGWAAELLGRVSLAYICARLVSGTINYWLNRKLVFKSGTKSSIVKYLVLAIAIMIVGALATGSLVKWGWNKFYVKIFVDTALYFINYYFQREWVFRKRRKKEKNQEK